MTALGRTALGILCAEGGSVRHPMPGRWIGADRRKADAEGRAPA